MCPRGVVRRVGLTGGEGLRVADLDAAQRVRHAPEALEVDLQDVVDRHSQQQLHRVHGERVAAPVEGRVDLRLAVAGHGDPRIPQHGHDVDLASVRGDVHEHHGVRALAHVLLALALAGVGAQDEHVQRAVPGRLLERPHVHRLPVVVEGAPERARVPGAQAEQRRQQDGEHADDPRPAPAAPRDRRGVVARGLGTRQGLGRPGRGRGMAHSGLLLEVGGQPSLRTPRQASAAAARRRRGLGWQRGHRWLARFMNGTRTMRESTPSAAQRRHGCPVRP